MSAAVGGFVWESKRNRLLAANRSRAQKAASEIVMLAARWARKASGRITPKEARQLAEKQAGSSYRYGFWASDILAARTPGGFAADYAMDTVGVRPERRAKTLAYRRQRAGDIFFHYGPTSDLWPGDRLVFQGDPQSTDPLKRGGWIVQRGNG